MKTSARCLLVFVTQSLFLIPSIDGADEAKVAVKKGVEAKPAQAAAKAETTADLKKEEPKKEEPKKPVDEREARIDAQVQQWLAQFTQQYRPMLNPELNFIRQVCDLTPEQRPKIKAAGEAAVHDAARQMAEMQAGRMRGGVRVAVGTITQPDPRKIIRDGLAKVLKETLTAEQMAKYNEEAVHRTALRKRAAIRCVVARLDETLRLNPDQRDRIAAAIESGWQDKWEQWLMLSAYGDQYFPNVPEQHVATHLNAEQKSVWSGLQKIEFGFFHAGGIVAEEDGWWGDEPFKPKQPNGESP